MKEPTIHTVTLAPGLPRDALRFVQVQPAVKEDSEEKGFRLTVASAAAQRASFAEAYRKMCDYGTQFLVVPEYGLPYVDVEQLDSQIEASLPTGGVVVAGLDAMPFAEFARLTAQDPWAPSAEAQKRHNGQWVNAVVIWARTAEGTVRRFLQPKLVAAKPERKLGGMYPGEYILRFEAGEFTFSFLICRDLIGRVQFPHERPGPRQQSLAEWLSDRWSDRPLDALFWLQYNDKPEERGFLTALESLLMNDAVRCVVAANHAGFGKSAFYFRSGHYVEEPRTADQPRSYAFQRVPGTPIYRARFRSDDPSAFLFTYHPYRGNALEQGMIPLEVEKEWQINSDGIFVGGPPVDPFAHGYDVAQKESLPSNSGPLGSAVPRYTSADVLSEHITHFTEVYRIIRAIRERDRRAITRTLFTRDGWGEPVEWSAEERRQVGTMLRALSALRFVGPINLPGGETATTARLTDPTRLTNSSRFVTVVCGYPGYSLGTCGEQSASALRTLYGKGLPAMTSLVVLSHAGSQQRVRVEEAVQRKLDEYAEPLSHVDMAPVPQGEPAVVERSRIDGSHIAWLSAHSYGSLEGFLLDAPNLDSAAELVKKEVMP